MGIPGTASMEKRSGAAPALALRFAARSGRPEG